MGFRMVVLVTAAVALAAAARADETTFCNFYITALPYTISTQGHYCFDRNLSTAITSGNAITINSDFVVVDLNNFKLGGGAAGLGTTTIGIHSDSHRNITIRNGNIRGFLVGIEFLGGSSAGGNVIENNVLDGNTYLGLSLEGDAAIVRNNMVSNTGGSTAGTYGYSIGISAYASQLVSVRDNTVSNTFSTSGIVVGIQAGANGVVDRNLVKLGSTTGRKIGIECCGYARDNTVLGATNSSYAFYQMTLIGHNYSNP